MGRMQAFAHILEFKLVLDLVNYFSTYISSASPTKMKKKFKNSSVVM